MSQYYIDTANGPRGPYPKQQIIDGVRQGQVPAAAVIRDAETGATMRAADLSLPSDSGSQQPVVNNAAPQYRTQQPANQQFYAQPQQPRPAQQYPQPQYPAPNPQQYGQPQYPQQYGQQQQYPQPGHYQPYGANQQPGYYQTAQTSGLAIAAIALSLGSIAVCSLISIGGIICGVLALKECKPHGPKEGRGMALAGIWIGSILLVLTVAVIGLVIAADSL